MESQMETQTTSIESFVDAGDFVGLARYCEEVELTSPQGIPGPEIYGGLLAVYLLQNELDHAKLLWKRIPQSVKASNPEVGQLWEVGKRLWRREFAEVYEMIQEPSWPPHIAPILVCLTEQVRSRVLQLISRAYTDVSLADFSSLLGLSSEQAIIIAKDRGWEVDAKFVYPKPIIALADYDSKEDSYCKLARLVDIVSFLEN